VVVDRWAWVDFEAPVGWGGCGEIDLLALPRKRALPLR
jgi:hypothetical protein